MGSSQENCQSLTNGLFVSFNFSTLMALSCLFFTFTCSWLTMHVSWAFPIICGHLFILTVLYFLHTSFTNTGILHKGIDKELMNQAVTMNDPRQHWCNKCQLYCLPRTFHCPWCNTCVEEFDHHCVWVNNCISCHNLRFFVHFVVFLTCYDLAVLTSCLIYLVLNSQEPFNVEKICTVLVTIPAAFCLVPLLILLYSQIGRILAAQQKCKSQAPSASLLSVGMQDPPSLGMLWNNADKYRVKSAMPIGKAMVSEPRDAPKLHRGSQTSQANTVLVGSQPQEVIPRGQKALKAWRHILSVMGSLLRRQDLRPREAKEQDGKQRRDWQLNSPDRGMKITIPDMLGSVDLLGMDQKVHWKSQIHAGRRASSLPTATLLSVSDI